MDDNDVHSLGGMVFDRKRLTKEGKKKRKASAFAGMGGELFRIRSGKKGSNGKKKYVRGDCGGGKYAATRGI